MGRCRAKEYLPFPPLEVNLADIAHAGTVMGGYFSQNQEQYPFARSWIYINLEQKHIQEKYQEKRHKKDNRGHLKVIKGRTFKSNATK